MFALDLFNTKYEKSLQEGATDNTTEHLLKPLHLRAANILTQLRSGHTTPEKVAALTKEYEDLVAERMSILKGEHPESTNEMGYGSLGEDDMIPVGRMQPGTPEYAAARNRSVKYAELTPDYTGGHKTAGPTTVGYKKATNKPLVPGEVEVAEAGLPGNLPPEQIPGKEDLLKGKGRQTYEENIDEGFGPVGSKGLMNGNFATFMKARQNRTPVTLEIGGEEFRLTPTMMDAMAKKYLADKAASDAAPTNRDIKLIAVNNYRAFGYPQLMRAFIDGVATHDNTPPANVPGEQLPMFERTQQVQKKNSKKADPDLGAGTARDATVQRELQKVRARHPNARSDIEALVKDEIVNQERVDQELSQQQDNIQQQTAQLAQLGSVNRQQDTKINSLQQQLATAVQSIKSAPVTPATTKPASMPVSKPASVAPATTTVPSSITAALPVPQTAKDQEIYDKVQSLETELKDKIDAMASWNAIAQKDPQSNNELTALRKEVERTKKELQQQIIKLKPIKKKPTTQAPALSDPNVIDIDAWEVPGMAVPEVPDNIKTEPGTATPAKELPIDQLDHQVDTTPFAGGTKNNQWGPKNMPGGRFTVQDVDPYDIGVHEAVEPGEEISTNELLYRAAVEYMQHMGREGQPVDYETAVKLAAKHYHIPYRPGMVPELHAKRQELDAKLDAAIRARQAERGARKQRQLARTAPTTPEQEKKMQDYWSKNAPQATRVKAPTRSLEENQQLHVGDPIVVTAPNEFEGKTGEIYDFAPSGKFVIVNLYNHGKHSMHLSDVEYNQYANDQDEKEFWNGDKEVNESNMSELDAMRQDLELMNDRQFKVAYGISKVAFRQKYRALLNPAPQQDVPVEEGWQDFNKVEPYAVCLAGKPVKKFDYYEEARRFHDNWKKKLYREGNKEKADKITLMPIMDEGDDQNGQPRAGLPANFANRIMALDFPQRKIFRDYINSFNKIRQASADLNKMLAGFPKDIIDAYQQLTPEQQQSVSMVLEPGWEEENQLVQKYKNGVVKKQGVTEAGSPAQQAAIAIAMKRAGKKPKQADEGQFSVTDDPSAHIKVLFLKTINGNEYRLVKQGGVYKIYVNRSKKTKQEFPSFDLAKKALQQLLLNAVNTDEAYTPSPAKPFRNPRGFNKQGTGVGNKLAQQTRAELANIQPRKGTPVPAKEFAQGVLKDLKKVNVKEAEGSWIVYDPETKQIKKRFKTHTAGKSYAQTHGLGFASSEYYFDRVKEPVNELDVNTLKSYADKRGAQVAAMKADNPNPQTGSKEWVQQAVPAQQVGLANRKIARKERQQGVAEDWIDDDAAEPLAKYFADLYYGDFSATMKVKLTSHIYQAIQNGELSIEQLKADIDMLEKEKGIKEQGVAEGKGLAKKVKIVKGPDAGKTGWIREVKHGAFKGAPKTYYIDLDDGGQANNLPATALRLVKEQGMAEGYTPDTNYSYTIVGNGDESKAYDSKEEARDAMRKLGAGYKIKRKPRTSARSVKKHFSNRNMELGETHEPQKFIVTINGKATSPLYPDMADKLYIAAKRAQPNARVEKTVAQTTERQKGIDRVKAGYGDEDALELHEQLPSTPPANRKEYLDQRDKLFRMLAVDTNPVNKQIIKQALKDLDNRYGSIKNPVNEENSTSSEAVEIALIRRVLVAHTDLIMDFGLDKVTQAIEEVAYNVGDVDEIGTSDVSGWIHQVKQILGVE